METANSGTGVFYQALPAIGVDGKKIMKLIPVRMVNGEYVQILTSRPKPTQTLLNVAAPPVLVTPRPPVGPPAMQQWSSMNALSTPGDSSLVSLLTKQPHAVNYLSNFPPMQTFIINNGHKPMAQHPSQLPVTVKTSALFNGQCLQIQPNAQILTGPAAEVPQNVKKHILTSQHGSSSSPAAVSPSVQLPSPVMFVSPVSAVSPRVNPPGQSSPDPVQQTSPGAKPQLKLTQMVSRRPNSPTRWVVEEMGVSAAVNVKPSQSFPVPSDVPQTNWANGAVVQEAGVQPSQINSAEGPAVLRKVVINDGGVGTGVTQSVISRLIQVLSERKAVGAQHEAVKDVPSPSSQLQDNTLLMCDGKVFFVSKQKDVSPQATEGSKSQQTAAVDSSAASVAGGRESLICSESGQTGTAESPPASVTRAAPKSRAERRTVCEVIEVIDLCDEEEPPQQARPVAQHDEDNVIFVSYSPPKPQSGSTALNVSPAQGKGTECAGSGGSGRTGAPDRSSSARLGGSAVNHRVGSEELPDIVEVEAETESPGGLTSGRETENHQNVRAQTPPSCLVNEPPDIVEVEAETASPGGLTSSRETENNDNLSSSCAHICTLESCSLTDSQLRRIHGVTADVRVSLQRIDEAAPPPRDGQPGQREADLCKAAQEDVQPVSPSQTPPCLSPQTLGLEKPRRGRRPAAAFTGSTCEDRSAVQPKAARVGRTRKRTMCKCCCPEAPPSSGSAEDALTEPAGKRRAGARTPAGDHQACRGHTSPRGRNSEEPRHRVHVQTAKGSAHKKLMTSGVS